MKPIDEFEGLRATKATLEDKVKEINKKLKVLEGQITETFNNEGILKAVCTNPGVTIGLVKTIYAHVEDKVEFKKYLVNNNLANSFLEEKIIKKKVDELARNIHKQAFINGQKPQFPPGFSSYTVMALRVYRETTTQKFEKAAETLLEKIEAGVWE